MTGSRRRLVVNADDFGLSRGVNRGIIEAHLNGIVTSTSLMVRSSWATDGVNATRTAPGLSVGLHVDLGSWEYIDGEWQVREAVVALDDADAVRDEVHRQVEAFIRLVGKTPTHLDSHQHVHRGEPARTVVSETAKRLSVPLRASTPGIVYCGEFHGQTSKGEPLPAAVSVDALVGIIRRLAPGVTELGCHPGYVASLRDPYATEREIELLSLCDPKIAEAITNADVELCSYAELADFPHTCPL